MVAPGDHDRKVSGILGLLVKTQFPGILQYAGKKVPAYTWNHYIGVPNVMDREGKRFNTKADPVLAELCVSLLALHCSIHRIYWTFLK